MTAQPQFLIGIDLGTTHCVLAYADLQQPLTADNCQIFDIEQLVAPGEVGKRPLLPSFRYHPTAGEIDANDMLLPWSADADVYLQGELPQVVIGEWARQLGAKVDGRQVVSAKSWLSHPQVDRAAPILPWAGADGVEKVSPVFASASYLHYLKKAWNNAHPNAPFEQQEIVVTVPASFDESARALTVEAAELAGLTNIVLLEEPQAVCYDWYARQGDAAQQALAKMRLLLVCDVGGGTTDLSLIKVAKGKDDQLSLTRIGVGNHLMLGGDNVDLALAHHSEQQINGKNSAKKLSASALSQLIQQTRQAKELLLSDNAPDSANVTILGSGARLIGGAKRATLTQQWVRDIALDGFFPLSAFDQLPNTRRSAVVEFGLPYAADPAVSKHIAAFLNEHQTACRDALSLTNDTDQAAIPDAVLFNGGVFNSPLLSARAHTVLSTWAQSPVQVLDNNNPDLAVAQGAVAYAKARRGAQLKIGGGSARTFFLALANDNDDSRQAVCIMPKGTEENHELHLSDRQFVLRLGQPIQFHLYSTTHDHPYKAGEIITLNDDDISSQRFISLPPLVVAMDAGLDVEIDNDNDKKEQVVQLAANLSEVGTLQLDCISNTEQRWHVAFEVRQKAGAQASPANTDKLPDGFDVIQQKIDDVYGDSKKKANPKAVKTLRADIEKRLGKRDSWEIPVLRTLFDQFLTNEKRRRRSAAHERVWFTLAGYALRPGFGYPADEWRIEKIWPYYKQGLQFAQETQLWSAWWMFWARAAGGLSDEQQQQIFNDVRQYIDAQKLSSRKTQADGKQKSYEDIVKLLAALEKLPPTDKINMAESLLKRLEKPAESQNSWWALGRIATRTPFHGSAHNVIDKNTVQQWLPAILNTDWKKNPHAAFCAVMMTRKSGDRVRDVDEQWQQQVVEKLTASKAPASWIEMVSTVKTLDEAETKRVFGEALPIGLRLVS
ncbi:Chaperone protein DnaK [BD1-7 clade bacterium]|nr:Chaperone protein DnaK [BD1-7 clade bacterium]